jgi:hypothetical protein
MKNPQELIGRKVRGFEFNHQEECLFSQTMKKYIGKIGIIKELGSKYKIAFKVLFDDGEFYYYPADQIEAHLVEEEVPTLSDGVMMLVSDDGWKWHKQKVIGKKDNYFYAWNKYTIVYWTHAKPLEPTKEEQLTAILGSSEKVSEIMELFKK